MRTKIDARHPHRHGHLSADRAADRRRAPTRRAPARRHPRHRPSSWPASSSSSSSSTISPARSSPTPSSAASAATLDSYAASLLPERVGRCCRRTTAISPTYCGASGGPIASPQRRLHPVHRSCRHRRRRRSKRPRPSRSSPTAPASSSSPGDTVARGSSRRRPSSALQPASARRRSRRRARTRTAVQDLEYSIRQLVEIALRALSPGVNDPHTALAVIDRLTASIADHPATRHLPEPVLRDERRHHPPDSVRQPISPASSTPPSIEIRQAGAAQPAILIRLADRLGQLLAHANPDANERAGPSRRSGASNRARASPPPPTRASSRNASLPQRGRSPKAGQPDSHPG